jgi:hypothetical protein
MTTSKIKFLRYRRGAFLSALFVLLFAACGARAQVAAYGGFSGGPVNGPGVSAAYGATVGVYAQSGHFVSLGGDARGTFLSHNGFHYYTGAVGPRLAIKPPILPFRPYVEGLIGAANFNGGSGTSSTTKFNYQALGGVDFTFFPHLDWRVIEFAYSGAEGSSVNAKIFTTGLVLRLW